MHVGVVVSSGVDHCSVLATFFSQQNLAYSTFAAARKLLPALQRSQFWVQLGNWWRRIIHTDPPIDRSIGRRVGMARIAWAMGGGGGGGDEL